MARTQQGNDQTTNAHKFIMMNILNRLERYGLLIWSVPEGRRLEPHREDVSHAAQGSQGQDKKENFRQDSSASFDDTDISIITHYLPIVYSKNEHRLVGAERAWQRAQRAKQIHVHLLLVQSTVPMCTGRSAGTRTCVSASLLRDLELAHQVRIYVEQSSYISC